MDGVRREKTAGQISKRLSPMVHGALEHHIAQKFTGSVTIEIHTELSAGGIRSMQLRTTTTEQRG